MLSDIKVYFKNHRQATLADLALHFDKEPEVMRDMLAQWIRKGRLAKSNLAACCGRGCTGCCNQAAMELYAWKK